MTLDTAYFPGSGPSDRRCSDCTHWHVVRTSGRCRKAAEMRRVGVMTLAPVVSNTQACKYYEERQNLKLEELV